MDSTASSGPGRNPSVPLHHMRITSWFPVLTTTLRAQWGGTLSTSTWSLISSGCHHMLFPFTQCNVSLSRMSSGSLIYAPLLHSPASRWADIPLITDGALVHAWHRYNTTWYSHEDIWCMCVAKSVVAGTTRTLKSGRLSRRKCNLWMFSAVTPFNYVELNPNWN